MRIPILAAGLVAVLAGVPQLAAQEAELLRDSAHAAMNAGRWADAEAWFDRLHELSPPTASDSVNFWRGFAAYKQGEAIARANARTGAVADAIVARDHFRRARTHVVDAAHPEQPHLLVAVETYILDQGKIIAAQRE